MKITENSLKELWVNIKCTNIRIYGSQKKHKERVWENFWRNYSWKFPQHGKGTSQSSPRGAKSSIQDKSRRNMTKHTLIKLMKTKHKERLLKAARQKQQWHTRETPYVYQLIFQQKLCRPEGNGRIYLKYSKGKIYNQDYCTWQGSHSKLMEK